jgi:filamentous hemagglutinin family protein
MAITLGSTGGTATGTAGRGTASNLQNAGAASAAMTAALARKSIERSDTAVGAMRAMQQNAAAAAKAAARSGNPILPNGQTVNGSPVIPNGLVANWLHPHDGFDGSGKPLTTSWKGASINMEKTGLQSSGDHNVEITQSEQSAYLYWKDFNVGPKTTINFNQTKGGVDAGKWIAFNKITGTASPSSVYGKIRAQGQVYILNQNGIMFHNGSEVNVHALVASTLPINPYLAGDPMNGITGRGLLNNPDNQFLFSALPVAGGKNGPSSAFTPPVAPAAGIGNVVVEKGARLTCPVDDNNTGGLLALIAPGVINNGWLETPNGQTILAAGLEVALKSHPVADPSLRGLDVIIGKVADTGVKTVSSAPGSVINGGLIEVPRGNVVLAGKSINQNGVLNSSTSATLNGRIELSASYDAYNNENYIPNAGYDEFRQGKTGNIDFGSFVFSGITYGSVSRILPEWSSADKVPGTSLALNSIISVVGKDIVVNKGSVVLAPGATGTPGAVDLVGRGDGLRLLGDSGIRFSAGIWDNLNANSKLYYPEGSITIGEDAIIDAAGSTEVKVNGLQNFLEIQLRGPELANSPLQRNGKIRGQTITVDSRISGFFNGQRWIGTPLGDATGYLNTILRSVSELTVKGGSVSLAAGGALSIAPNSTINVSGGWKEFSDASVAISRVLYQGRPMDISKARPDLVYDGLVERVSKTFYPGYYSGGDGGTLTLQGGQINFTGSLHGIVVNGNRQVRNASGKSELATPSSINLNFFSQRIYNNNPANWSPIALDFTISNDLFGKIEGFGNISIDNRNAGVTLDKEVTLNLGNGGKFSVIASQITILGSIMAPSGDISLKAKAISYELLSAYNDLTILNDPLTEILSRASLGQDVLRIGSSSSYLTSDGRIVPIGAEDLKDSHSGTVLISDSSLISTAGSLVNDVDYDSSRITGATLQGGDIFISGYQVFTGSQSLDVSGGARIRVDRSVEYGDAGKISISAGWVEEIPSIANGSITMNSELKGYSGVGAKGGSLEIRAPLVRLGESDIEKGLFLPVDFFNRGGFSTYSIGGLGHSIGGVEIPGLRVSSEAVINPQVLSQNIGFSAGIPFLRPYRPASVLAPPVTISLSAISAVESKLSVGSRVLVKGELVVDSGASMIATPGLIVSDGETSSRTGSINLSGNIVVVAGSLIAPGGDITINGATSTGAIIDAAAPPSPRFTTVIAPEAIISTRGSVLSISDGIRPRMGNVLSGGSVSITGNILAEERSIIDVSGSSGILDFYPYQIGELAKANFPYQSLEVESDGGSIMFSGGEVLRVASSLNAGSGGDASNGGLITFNSGIYHTKEDYKINSYKEDNLIIGSFLNAKPFGFSYSGIGAAGVEVPWEWGAATSGGGGKISSDVIARSKADRVELLGNVRFDGSLSLSLPGSLKVATGGILSVTGDVVLAADHVSLGQEFRPPLAADDTSLKSVMNWYSDATSDDVYVLPAGSSKGSLTVKDASQIDIGHLSIKGASVTTLTASKGTIRGNGFLDVAGHLGVNAAMLTAAPGTKFTITAYDYLSGGNGEFWNAVSGGIGANLVEGSITIQSDESVSSPITAAGSVAMYASKLDVDGTIHVPFGQISLGWDGIGQSPVNSLSGFGIDSVKTAPVTKNLFLGSHAIVSVAGRDVISKNDLTVNYGTSSDGATWIDPGGNNITSTGLPGKAVSLNSLNLVVDTKSLIDISGGGSVSAYQFISGLGGKNNLLADTIGIWSYSTSYSPGDLVSRSGRTWSSQQRQSGNDPLSGSSAWVELPERYTILPDYKSDFAPAGYGYETSLEPLKLMISGGAGLNPGTYTLLPASYASLPGAYLVSKPIDSLLTASPGRSPNGETLTYGTLFVSSGSALGVSPLKSPWIVTPPSLLRSVPIQEKFPQGKVEFNRPDAVNDFGATGASAPRNAGRGTIIAEQLDFRGVIAGMASAGGSSAMVDLSGPSKITIGKERSPLFVEGSFLDAGIVNRWTVSSILIGGTRFSLDTGDTGISVSAEQIDLEKDTSLSAEEIILASTATMVFDEESRLVAKPAKIESENLVIQGDGVMVRVSSGSASSLSRQNRPEASDARLSIGEGVELQGTFIQLDSADKFSMAKDALLSGLPDATSKNNISISSGKMILSFLESPITDESALVLAGDQLSQLQLASSLNLTSYSFIDFYGGSSFGNDKLDLQFHAGEIRGNALDGEVLAITGSQIQIDNMVGSKMSERPSSVVDGYLEMNAPVIKLGKGLISIDQFSGVSLNASGIIYAGDKGVVQVGSGDQISHLYVTTPLISGESNASMSLKSTGDLILMRPDPEFVTPSAMGGGLAVSFNLEGDSVFLGSVIKSFGGKVDLNALSGDVTIDSVIDVGGTGVILNKVVKYVDAGSVNISSGKGNVAIGPSGSINLSALKEGGSAGSLSVSTPLGQLFISQDANLTATKGSGGEGGILSLDALSLDKNGIGYSSLATIAPKISDSGFTKSQDYRIRSGDVIVDDYVTSNEFSLSADHGSITVTPDGVVDASGKSGGNITLEASGSILLMPNSALSVHGEIYDNAGKGGSVFLSAGASVERVDENGNTYIDINRDAILDLQTGSSIDLGVTAAPDPLRQDQFGGTLHLRAPITADLLDIQMGFFDTTIDPSVRSYTSEEGDTLESAAARLGISVGQLKLANNLPKDLTDSSKLEIETKLKSVGSGASSIAVEGYRIYQLSGEITTNDRDRIVQDASDFFGTDVANTILTRLKANQDSDIRKILNLSPGVEIMNRSGNLTLESDWDLSRFRTGLNKAPGFLTLRANGDLIFNASLSDGFQSAANNARLVEYNNLLSPNFQSWSYNLSAGSDLGAASLLKSSKLANISLGKTKNAQRSNLVEPGQGDDTGAAAGGKSQTDQALASYFQIIRTGTGDIRISTGGDVRLLNQFASIYTVGSMSEKQSIGGLFDVPNVASWDTRYYSNDLNDRKLSDYLGNAQSQANYKAQYSSFGGSIFMDVGRNITRLQSRYDINHRLDQALSPYEWDETLTVDSTRVMPNSWLMRRGSTEADGTWSLADFTVSEGGGTEIMSTTWWINYSNYLGGIGALGGGNITVGARGSIANIDFSIPTQYRSTGRLYAGGSVIKASESSSIESGGGNLKLRTGSDVDGGSIYIERGDGELLVGGDLKSNKTRDAGSDYLYFLQNTSINLKYSDPNPSTWIPTGLFQGKGSMRVVTGGSALVAPKGNVFLQVQGINNPYQYKNFFSTFVTGDADANGLSVTALGGDITYRAMIFGIPTYQSWAFSGSIRKFGDHYMAGAYQPWIRSSEALIETPSNFSAISGLSAPSLELVSAVGNISLEGNITISPSEDGNLVMGAAKSINGLTRSRLLEGTPWTSSTINLSDASTEILPTAKRPYSETIFESTFLNLKQAADALEESGSYYGNNKTLNIQMLRHDSKILHLNDAIPVLISASAGDITGFRLFSPKATEISAGRDIGDIAIYIQNVGTGDRSVISAGGNITPYNPFTRSQKLAQPQQGSEDFKASIIQSGDIQISGPGRLEITAGGDIDLGLAPDRASKIAPPDPTIWNGITSVGNARNPFLPFAGADISFSVGYDANYRDGMGSLLTSVDDLVESGWKAIRDKVSQSQDKAFLGKWGKLRDDASYSFLVSKDKLWVILQVADSLTQTEYGNLKAKFAAQSPELWDYVESNRNNLQGIIDSADSPTMSLRLQEAGLSAEQALALVKKKSTDSGYRISYDDVLNSIRTKDLTADLESQISGFWSGLNESGDLSASEKVAVAETLYGNLLKKSGRNYNNQDSPEYKTYELGGKSVASVYGGSWYEKLADRFTDNGVRTKITDVFEGISSKDSGSLTDSEKNILKYWKGLDAGILSSQELFSKILENSQGAGFVAVDDHNEDRPMASAANEVLKMAFGSDFKGAGSLLSRARDIRTQNGGSISIFAPGGGISLSSIDPNQKDPPFGIVSAYGGGVTIYTQDSVSIGIGRIFTLRGGNIVIWSDRGDIAAGSSAKTVLSAPPTRVLIDPQSAAVQTDLAGLSTGGGIGALAAVKNVPIADIDLIAPSGVIDAGDAGIRSTGNLNLAATKILNADNILVGGVTVGAPPPAAPSAPPPAAPPPAAPPAGATAAAAAGNSAAENAASKNDRNDQGDQPPSIYSIDILGYGGGDDEDKKAADATVAPVQASL